MPSFLKSSFLWQFAGGFILGGIGLFTLHPGEAKTAFESAPFHQAR